MEEENENKLLLLLDSHIDFASEKLDALKDFKNIVWETLDGHLIKMGLKQLNKAVSPYVPDEYKPDIHEALTAIVNEDYGEAAENGIEVLELALENMKKLPPVVKEIASGLLEIIKATVVALIEDKKE